MTVGDFEGPKSIPSWTYLDSAPYRLTPSVRAIRLRTRVFDDIVLPVEIRNKHGAIVQIAPRLIV
jgi:hypothetical protein